MAKVEEQGSRRKYRDVYDRLRARLDAGEYRVGSVLPTEEELEAEFQVSRYSLREALSVLERQGYIERKRRAGTRVLGRPAINTFRHAVSSLNELNVFVQHTNINFGPAELIEADGHLARDLGCDELRRWHRMEGTRINAADNRPIGVGHIYIDATRATVSGNTDFGHKPVYEWLHDNHGIQTASVSQDISAVQLDEAQSRVFGEREGAPALRIVRRYFDDKQRIFLISVTVHRSENFIYNLRVQVV